MDLSDKDQKRVLVAMSGGVDSSVTAGLLRDAGYEVTGVFMCLGMSGDADSDSRGCCSPQDAADARAVAHKLGIELYVLNLADAFAPIIEYFVDEYRHGRTPNPCVPCNAQIKFGRLLRHAATLGIPWVATGHYARLLPFAGQPAIWRKSPRRKDQSYVLFGIARELLGRILFPLGDMPDKRDVRDKARAMGLAVHDKPDSQEICFVPDNDYVAYLSRRCPEALRPGRIVDSGGKVLGRHRGIAAFTIGQRKGLGLASKSPLFVTHLDVAAAEVRVGPRSEILHRGLQATGANWHCDVQGEFEVTVQVRYNHAGSLARVQVTGSGTFAVRFNEPVLAVTPGQAAVCYDGDRLLGGGWIESVI
ncbi:MAG TPA: tRNA 2-thiouridine(34) synthase MnmA [Polyangia bacterium]